MNETWDAEKKIGKMGGFYHLIGNVAEFAVDPYSAEGNQMKYYVFGPSCLSPVSSQH